MKIGGLEINWKAKTQDIRNLLNQAFYQFIGNGSVMWLNKDRSSYVNKGYSDNEIVFSIVRLLLSKLTEAPLMLSEVKDEKELKKYKSWLKKGGDGTLRMQTMLMQAKALEEVERHPLIDLLNKPNDYQSQAEFLEAAFGFYKLLGETFIYGIGPGEDSINFGQFTELHVLPAHLVEPVFGSWNEPIEFYKFSIGDQAIKIPAAHIMHLKTWNPNWDTNGQQLRGFSPLEAGSKVLTRNNYNKEAQTKAFINGGKAFLLSSSNSDRPMDKEQVDLLNDRIREKLSGVENFRNFVATNGLVTATPIGDTPADLGLQEADDKDLRRICMLFGVDADLFIGDSTFNNKEYALKSLVTNVILADLIRFRDKLNSWLLPGYIKDKKKYFLDFDTTVFAELQPDLKLMKEVYGSMWQFTPNEVRSVFKWDAHEDPNMDKIYIPMGLSELGSMNVDDAEFEKAYKRDYEE
jgi:HK97 family phage portal protein